MTDKERLLELLEAYGVTPSPSDSYVVSLHAKEGGVAGYTGFYCEFSFDKEGKFLNVGVWE